ncbi:hypothetical protein RDV64_15775 [Acuticoccus sp. MNP-M23]|uniref:hypothetical protein n=1 Tax=Acuticoccus sp. MNP-M23 TaxID=3072793 RepID=UPI0028157AA1|nr:hypothetical protein [Acuticoccus sp. MNP-M23]WMS41531.1 hypothetical protein RDV64_15775 [Acuticoccus sp. MNP-M23]
MVRHVALAAAVALFAAPAFAQSAEKPVASAVTAPAQSTTVATTPQPASTPAGTSVRQVGAGKSGCSWSSAKAYPTS